MDLIRKLENGRSQIITDVAFCELLKKRLPNKDKSFEDLIAEFDKKLLTADKNITSQALSNTHGAWYEWLLAISAWNFYANNKNADLAIQTPNISRFDVASLYNKRLFSLIEDLRKKVLDKSDVQLISSNPDFVIISRDVIAKSGLKVEEIKKIDVSSIHKIANFYSHIKNKCDFDDIKGYISVKKSVRPDRRLQIPHEGSLMKAIYTHLQTREWVIKPKGIKYYAIIGRLGEADIKALKTVATHSITTVHSIPQAAVDDAFEVNSLQQADYVFSKILTF